MFSTPRLTLIDQLRKQLLGPRAGSFEELPEMLDPRDEYVCGLLADEPSLGEEAKPEPESETLDLQGESELDGEDEQESSVGLVDWKPVCDPRREPSSMGVSFLIKAPALSEIEVCCTFARYQLSEQVWKRTPSTHVHSFTVQDGRESLPLQPLVSTLEFRCRALKDGVWQCTLRLVHRSGGAVGAGKRSERLLFQPQIRVLLGKGSELLPLSEFERSRPGPVDEDSRLRLLYRGQPIKARGHFCAAVWREIDPEQPAREGSPWVWEDGQLLEPEQGRRFAHCDLRTEVLPVLAVQTPQPGWRSEFGPAPILKADLLAEVKDGEVLREALQPMLDGYQSWIEQLRSELLEERYQRVAEEHLERCENSLRRMKEGLELLCRDEVLRRAFRFSNQALALQARWKGQVLVWRPFQMGFFLQTAAGLSDPQHPDRGVCDLLWFPTGGGKTEAYLAIIAFVAALRRLRGDGFDGTAVISRYTLRLLSIQQFRRTLGLMLACEKLRMERWCGSSWGDHAFRVGLWVGGSLTPNRLESQDYRGLMTGALERLENPTRPSQGEPAQVIECPCCSTPLALPPESRGSAEGMLEAVQLHLTVSGWDGRTCAYEDLSSENVEVAHFEVTPLGAAGWSTMSFELVGKGCSISANTIRNWWQVSAQELGVSLGCSDASRPGYFFIQRGRSPRNNDFVIYCPNPKCELVGTAWSETYPGGHRCPVPTPFEVSPGQADRVAIPALTVDDQVFGFPPTVLLATVDKFARLAFEPRAATIFGNCERFHPREGFYRRHCVRDDDRLEPAHAGDGLAVAVLPPPDLVLQDELHLVDGPLGSMVGLYESVIDGLIRRTHPPKYIASTATVREAEVQVKSLFNRSLCQFPAAGLRAEDNFFALIGAGNPFQEKGSGRLYLGMCGFGRGALTPLVRIWAVLLQTLEELRKAGCPAEQFDPYWTPVGYFNSITQLATVSGLWRQYIPQRMQNLSNEPRDIGDAVELSSRMESQRLPLILSHLGRPYPQAPSGVLATSMFGTGVDVSRLSLMVVHGQPKTTSSYIQATGRVGREVPGLVVVAFAPTRPRELNHYEYFTGYHQQLYRGVEPVNVYPFAPRARERGMGPALVAWQRQCPNAIEGWRRDARVIADESLEEGFGLMLERSQSQPEMRRPDALEVRGELQDCQQKWQKVACEQLDLEYQENTLMRSPSKPVVLGDEQHQRAGLPVVFRNAPQSLREVEATTGFRV